MTGELLAGLFYLAAIAFGLLVGQFRLERHRRLTSRQIARLHEALRLRQLWMEARRHEVATLLEMWGDPHSEKEEEFEAELARQARRIGLDTDGRALGGFPPPRELAPAEYAELASLSGRQI